MGALPPQKQIQMNQIPGAPSWLTALLTPLNKILGQLYENANRGTAVGKEIDWQYQTLTVSITNGTWKPQQFKVTTVNPVKGVQVIGVTGPVAPVGAVVVNSWSVSGNQCTISSLTGLGNGTYNITLIVMT